MSVNPAPVIGAAFGLVSEMINVEVLLTPTAAGTKTLDTSGGSSVVNVALAAAEFEPLVEVNAPTGIVLVYAPAAAAVTRTVMMQLLLPGK